MSSDDGRWFSDNFDIYGDLGGDQYEIAEEEPEEDIPLSRRPPTAVIHEMLVEMEGLKSRVNKLEEIVKSRGNFEF